MGKCRYCGTWAGFSKHVHTNCEESHIREERARQLQEREESDKVNQIRSLISFASDGHVSVDELAELIAPIATKESGLIWQAICVWTKELAAGTDDHPLPTREEETLLVAICNHYGFKATDLPDNKLDRIVRCCALRDLQEGKIPDRQQVVGKLPFNLHATERVVWLFHNAKYYQALHAPVRPDAGFCVRVVSDLDPHTDESVRSLDQEGFVLIDSGSLALTDRAIHFHGTDNSFRVRLSEIASMDRYDCGFAVCGRIPNAPNHGFHAQDVFSDFPYLLAGELSRLAAESATKRIPFETLIGQADIVARLRALAEFFAPKGGALGHILLIGEEGMGKSEIAVTVANELDVGYQAFNASEIIQQGDLTAVLTNLRERQVLMCANIQRLRKPFVEILRAALRDYRLPITIGQGPAARTHIMEIRPFTFIATCPKKPDCPAELLAQFPLILEIQPYSRPELQIIAERIAQREGVTLDSGAAELLAGSCDGRPGHLESMFQRIIRPLNKSAISGDDVLQAFTAFGIKARLDATPNGAGNLQDLSGIDFEKLISALLTRMGFQTEMTKTSGDGGIDIIATLDKAIFGGRYLFQCKRFAPDNLVGAPTVRDFFGAVTADRAVKGTLITTSDFTVQAREFAQRVGVELIPLGRLEKLLSEYGLKEVPGE
jgi:Holliday junction resolvasome RuvABC ATP-dependent DNA helicase subunit